MGIWKDILGYEGLYQISNQGVVKSFDRITNTKHNSKQIRKGKILKMYKKRYCAVSLSNNVGVVETKHIHRLVAETFIPNPLNKPTVNHISGIKTDNRVANLEWATYKENIVHSFKNNLQNNNCHKKSVIMKDLKDKKLKIFDSIIEASKETGFNRQSIGNCCNGQRKTSHGYKWKFVYEMPKE